MPAFEPGRDLNRYFYNDIVAPLLGDVPHAAALLGYGSDVLGYDDARSTDHGWGPRLQVFVAAADVAAAAARIDAGLPDTFRGWPTRFGWDDVAVTARVFTGTLGDWLTGQLGVDPLRGLSTPDWLVLPQQHILEVVRGTVYADPDGALGSVRASLAWYPDDVWRYLVACQWRRLDEDEPFVGRTAEVGDELGSALLAARQVGEVMRLAFLLSRQYAPYRKWFGTAFADLPCAPALLPSLSAAVEARDHATREDALVAAYETIARLHNEILPSCAAEPTARPFYDRPFRVLGARRFVEACVATIDDPALRALPLVGGIDQVSDSTDVRDSLDAAGRLRALYA